VLFMRHTQTYLLLKWAISHGDIGLLRQALRQCCVIFQSKQASTGNYARDLIRYLHWVDSSATDKVLQDSILSSALINPSGRPDGFIPVDRHLEALNGDIRTHMMDDRSSYSKEAAAGFIQKKKRIMISSNQPYLSAKSHCGKN